MKILLFGQHGQLARAFGEELRGHQLTVAARPEVDLAELGRGAAAVARGGWDLVINAAAFTAVDQAEQDAEACNRLNVEAPAELARAANEIGAPMVHVSTDYVFDGSADRPYREDDLTAPLGAYGRSKLAGEQAVARANPRHLILRTAWLISPWGRNFVRTMIDAASQRDELRVVADQRGSPTSATDLAGGIAAAAERLRSGEPAWGTYHLAGAGSASWHELAAATMEEAAANGLRSVPVRPITTADWPTPAPRPANSVLDSGRFEQEFGFSMPPWRQSLATIVKRIAEDRRREAAA